MNLVICQSNPHTTHDGRAATYAVLYDALTAKRAGMLQVVELGDGTVEYRTADHRTLPLNFSWDDAIRYTVDEHQQRRARRPSQPIKPSRIRHQGQGPWYTPPKPVHPMRRLLVARLSERFARKATA